MQKTFLLFSLLATLCFFFLLKDQFVTASGGYFSPSERSTIHRLLKDHNENAVRDFIGARLREFDGARNSSSPPVTHQGGHHNTRNNRNRRVRVNGQRVLRATTGSSSSVTTGSSSSVTTGGSGQPADTCTCQCNSGNLDFVNPSAGYGKYCGAGYGCSTGDAGCDPLDNCCAAHDACVGETGYCRSCQCNIVLANCAARVEGRGFSPCNSQQDAVDSLLDDICTAIKFAPNSCGGCESELIPASCSGYPSIF